MPSPGGASRPKGRQSGQLIWAGRLHLGDDPGIFGDATYVGLATELPLTLHPFDAKSARVDDVCFVIAAEHVGTYVPFPGPQVSLYAFEPEPRQTAWVRTKVGGPFHFDGSIARARPVNPVDQHYFAVRVEVDASVAPGFYNDFVLLSLALESATHHAEFGFRTNTTHPV